MTGAERADFERRQAAHAEKEKREKALRMKDTWGRQHAPGPTIETCDECRSPAVYARGDFGRPSDRPERFCPRHAPESLKRPAA